MKTASLFRLLAGAGLLAAASAGSAATLSANGRIVPASGVIDVYGSAGSRVEAVLVREGDWVEPGAVLVRLSDAGAAASRAASAESRLAALRHNAAADEAVARLRLDYAEQEAQFAADRYTRVEKSKHNDFVSPDTVESRRLERVKADADLAAARATLERTISDGAAAVTAGELELADARAQQGRAQPAAPLKARVLKVRARPGQLVDNSELFKLGDTSAINVITEIFETDAIKVKPGQHATISSPGLKDKFTGVVQSVGSLVYRDTLDSLDPNRQGTSHVVEAVVRLDRVEPLDRLIFLQVEVAIDL